MKDVNYKGSVAEAWQGYLRTVLKPLFDTAVDPVTAGFAVFVAERAFHAGAFLVAAALVEARAPNAGPGAVDALVLALLDDAAAHATELDASVRSLEALVTDLRAAAARKKGPSA